MVEKRATKLHAPKAVAENSVGNTSALAMYREQKLLARPYLAISTKAGNALVSEKHIMRIEPVAHRLM